MVLAEVLTTVELLTTALTAGMALLRVCRRRHQTQEDEGGAHPCAPDHCRHGAIVLLIPAAAGPLIA